jgi:hypothetical protein
MKSIETYIKARTIIRAVVLICVLCVATLAFRSSIFTQVEKGSQARRRLLCQTDYEMLRNAGRDLLSQLGGKEGIYMRDGQAEPPTIQFPKVILDLVPKSVRISDDGSLGIWVFADGMYKCGVYVYPEGYEKVHPGQRLGDRELVDGLWYFDSEYDTDPAYGKVIDKLVEKGGDRGQPPIK